MIQANALSIPLKDESVQCVVTSPPYWGLRDYDINGQLGLEKTPEEYVENTVTWAREVWRVLRKDGCFFLNLGDSYWGGKGQSGQSSPEYHVARTDSPITKPQSNIGGHGKTRPQDGKHETLKPKDLCEIPSDVVRALRKDGWWLRSRLPWVKRSAMPESCTDRPASALEYMFLLTKSSKCYFDMNAIRKGVTGNAHAGRKDQELSPRYGASDMDGHNQRNGTWRQSYLPSSRNFRNTDLFYQSLEEPHGAIFAGDEMVGLDVNPQPFDIEMCENCQEVYLGKEYRKLKIHTGIKDGKKVESRICKICKMWDNWLSHFATFPEWLITPLIKAGTSEKGACPECGAPWERIVEKEKTPRRSVNSRAAIEPYKNPHGNFATERWDEPDKSKTIGWQPTCKCGYKITPRTSDTVTPHKPVPCVVLDPFGGSGTTKNVADRLGRRGVMCELKMEYIEMAKKRCHQEPSLFS